MRHIYRAKSIFDNIYRKSEKRYCLCLKLEYEERYTFGILNKLNKIFFLIHWLASFFEASRYFVDCSKKNKLEFKTQKMRQKENDMGQESKRVTSKGSTLT